MKFPPKTVIAKELEQRLLKLTMSHVVMTYNSLTNRYVFHNIYQGDYKFNCKFISEYTKTNIEVIGVYDLSLDIDLQLKEPYPWFM